MFILPYIPICTFLSMDWPEIKFYYNELLLFTPKVNWKIKYETIKSENDVQYILSV